MQTPLTPTAAPSSLPWERVRERATSRKACILGDLGVGKDCRHSGECPLPGPPPRGREKVAAGFAVSVGLKSNLDLQPLISGRLKSKKQPVQPIFLAAPLIPTAAPSSLPWERVRERATSRKACILSGWGIGEGCRNLENALSPTLPHRGGSGLQRIQALQVV